MALFQHNNNNNQHDLLPQERFRREEEQRLLANMQRSTVLGDFITVCRTDYAQAYADQWINGYSYTWFEYLLLANKYLRVPGDLNSELVYLPEDLSEVYLIEVPAQTPDLRFLTPQGRSDYQLTPGYEQAVNQAIAKDYAIPAKRSVYHSLDQQSEGWQLVIEQVFAGKIGAIEMEYNGIKYTYKFPQNQAEASAAAWTAQALRRGAYPQEESLRYNQKFEQVPSIPDGKSALVNVREYVAAPNQKAIFQRLSFQRTDLNPRDVTPGQPTTLFDISLGNDLAPQASVGEYLARQYVQLDHANPPVRFTKFF
jgi:hypothetical protein